MTTYCSNCEKQLKKGDGAFACNECYAIYCQGCGNMYANDDGEFVCMNCKGNLSFYNVEG